MCTISLTFCPYTCIRVYVTKAVWRVGWQVANEMEANGQGRVRE